MRLVGHFIAMGFRNEFNKLNNTGASCLILFIIWHYNYSEIAFFKILPLCMQHCYGHKLCYGHHNNVNHKGFIDFKTWHYITARHDAM